MIRAVIFDLGGVVLESPFDVIAGRERQDGFDISLFNQVASAPDGAWARHETGRISRDEFITAFEAECAVVGRVIDARRLLDDIEAYARPRMRVVEVIVKLRDNGFLVAALTNNWESPNADWEVSSFQARFDVFVESWVEGVHKPDPRIYLSACARLGVEPVECVFLDDIGRNLKTARDLGMATIKVTDVEQAIAELGHLVGLVL